MEPIASFSGLASGVQWRDMIDQIMQLERRPARLIEEQITRAQTRSSAWLSFQSKLTSFQDAAKALSDGTPFGAFSTSVAGTGFKATAAAGASPGSYSVEVLKLAAAEKLGGDVVASRSDPLGLSGEFWVNGSRIEVGAGDSLTDIAYTLNAANTGTNATGVSAAVVNAGSGWQLVLTSQRTGAAGVDLAGDATGVLQGLGLVDGGVSIKHATSDGALSDSFSSASTALGTLLGATGAAAQDVTIGGITVSIDLAGDSLNDIAAAITAAGGGAVRADVIAETVNGKSLYCLDISGATSFTDAGGVLGTIGVLQGGRAAVAQKRTAAVSLTAAGAAATASSDLKTLEVGGALANAADGDTFTVAGTRRDGTTFIQTLTVSSTTDVAGGRVKTLQDVLDALNGAGGYGEEVVGIEGGRLVATDAPAGASQLALSVVANNEGGGFLDFGAFEITTVGRAREIVNGSDAAVRIDGVYSTHATNAVSGAIPGVSLTLTGVTTEPGTVTVSRDVDAAVKAVKSLVDGYNGVAAFVTDQFTGGAGTSRPLAGDSSLRAMRSAILNAMRTTLTTGVGGSWTRLTDLGIEIQKDGTFSFDEATLRDALASDPTAVERMLGTHGATTGTGIRYVTASDSTVSGTYAVDISAPAATASALGATGLADGFYNGASETITITDLASGKSYARAMVAGQTAQDLVDGLNEEFATATAHTIGSATALQDAGAAPATGATTWEQISQGGLGAGVANGDTITIGGRRPDGSTFLETLTIEDVVTQDVAELLDRIGNALGADATVEIDATGKIVATATATGSSLMELTISSDNAGGGSLQLGTAVSTEGRTAAPLRASLEGGALRIDHDHYGSAAGFRIEYSDPATETELGLGGGAATEYTGADVQGTIGGMAATGAGLTLTGAEDTAIEGLAIQVETAFSAGSVTFSRGIASMVERALDPLLRSGDGAIPGLLDRLDQRVTSMSERIDDFEVRLERRRDSLIRRFTAMEQAMAVAQNQSAWLLSQIGALPGSYSSNSR